MSTWSPECTFLPLRYPHVINDPVAGARLIKRINRWLHEFGRKTGLWMTAKLDPHLPRDKGGYSYLVELTPVTHFHTHWLDPDDASYAGFMEGIDAIIAVMRKRFGLVPSLVTRKGDTDLHWPGGGQHVMLGADLFHCSPTFYRDMERFNRNLAVDYANRPYARWLLAHWIGDGGSRVAVNDERLALAPQFPITADEIFKRSLDRDYAIVPRFMASPKNSYLTFEFRIVGMVENARQMRSAVLLLKEWMDHHVARVERREPSIRFSLTLPQWETYTTEDGARAACKGWVESLGLAWADYEEDHFARNYLMRITHGAFV